MRKTLIALTAAGLLLSVPAIAQNSSTSNQSQNSPSATSSQQGQSGQQSGKTDRTQGRLQSEGGNDRVQSNTRERSSRGESRERMGRTESREGSSLSMREGSRSRTTVGINVHEREFRHRHGYRAEVIGFGHHDCRDVTIRSHHDGHVVIRHIRRCFR